jgi:KEOPS complex subunit Pcc1
LTSNNYDHHATLEFSYPDEHRARIIAASVRRELGEIDDDRSQATLDRTGATVTITVEAKDLVALRAGMNTWLGLVDVAERTAEITARS